MTEEEVVALPQVITAFLVLERLFELDKLWAMIEQAELPEATRIQVFAIAARSVRSHLGDVIRAAAGDTRVGAVAEMLAPGLAKVSAKADVLILAEVRDESAARRKQLEALGVSENIVNALVRLFELDGVFGIAAMGARKGIDELAVTRAYTRLGEVLGIDWAQQQVASFVPNDQWERLLAAGLLRDFEQLRIEFLNRTRSDDPDRSVERWVSENPKRIAQFRQLIERAKRAGAVTAPMLAQIALQARILVAR
jgi:glutamate dehydrogenase